MITYNAEKNEPLTIDFVLTDPTTMRPRDITGASFTVVAKAKLTDSTVAFTGTGTLWAPNADGDILGADISITPTVPGIYYVTINASGTGTGFPQIETFRMRVRDTATVGSPLQLSTDVDIANAALALCGHKRQITDFAENNPEAVMAGLMFAQARDALLSDVEWAFATRRIILTPPLDSTRSNWNYAYDLPGDLLVDRGIVVAGVRQPVISQRIPYAIEMNDDATGQILVTDEPEPELIYTARVEDPMLYPVYFTDALVARLATDMVVPLSIDIQAGRILAEMAEYRFRRAVAMNNRVGEPGPEPESQFITIRSS